MVLHNLCGKNAPVALQRQIHQNLGAIADIALLETGEDL